MNLECTNIYRYDDSPDNLDNMCLPDFAGSFIYEKADLNYEPVDYKSYIKPGTEIKEEQDLKKLQSQKNFKNWVGKNGKRNSANSYKISHCQQI